MEAARSAAARRLGLRDRLLAAEDSAASVSIATRDGALHCGRVDAVGTDHVLLSMGGQGRSLVLAHIVSLEVQR